VVAVGPGVRRLHVGDRVYGYDMKGGFYAEYTNVKESRLAPIPTSVDPREAGALGADGITALLGLQDQLGLRHGESLMIVGASGGIGHLAVQLARRIGARVFAVASHQDGVRLVQGLGADATVDGRKDDVSKAARDFAPNGFDAALVLAGGDDVNGWLDIIRKGGRIAYPNGVEPEPRPPEGVKALPYDGTPSAEAFDRLNALIGNEPFHVELGHVFELDQLPEAQRAVEKHHLGKLAVRIH
jgi:NADPH:quinone reductase-like Zn-dependent oxidoreductase